MADWNKYKRDGETWWSWGDDERFAIQKLKAGTAEASTYELYEGGGWVGSYSALYIAQLEATRRLCAPGVAAPDIQIGQSASISGGGSISADGEGVPEFTDDAAWRFDQYVVHGIPFDLAERLALETDEGGVPLDWHRVIEMFEAGCSPELAEAILV
jgi:hypothetical protein